MKHWTVVVAALVFLGIGLGIWLERPPPPEQLEGQPMALPPQLPALEVPGGDLRLEGTVRSAAGAPLEEVFVCLLRPDDDDTEVEPIASAYTAADGAFHLSGLSPGSFRVLLQHPSAPPTSLELVLEGDRTGDQAVAWSLSAPLEPLPELPPIRRTAVSGRIAWPEGSAGAPTSLEGFEVVFAPAPSTPLLAGAATRRVRTDSEGRFRIEELVVAPYLLEVLPPWARGGSHPVLGRASWSEDGPEPSIPLVVGGLDGDVREQDGRPLAGALVRVSAEDAPDPAGQPELWPPQVTDANGHFELELLPPGRYRVHVRAGLTASDRVVEVRGGERTVVDMGRLEQRLPVGPGG